MQNFVSKKLCWFMIFLLIFMWSGIIENKAFAQQINDPNPEELKQTVDKLERLFDALEEAVQELPRDTFDPEAIIEKVGRDPIMLYEWVCNNTYLIPYRGLLRGPVGVLMDRSGNNLDRSLLLAEMLELVGYEVRLVHAFLSRDKANKILQEISQFGNKYFPTTSGNQLSTDELIKLYAKNYRFNPDELREIINESTTEFNRTTKEALKRISDQTKILADAIGALPMANDLSEREEANALEAIRDHWWVQIAKNDTWLDLDLVLKTASPGQTLAEAQETYNPNNLDNDLYHTVNIRVIIEKWEEERLKEEKVLEHTLRPGELIGKRIVLHHFPMNWPEDLNLFEEEKPLESIKEIIQEEEEWLPVLTIETDQVTACSFKVSGEINDNPGKKSKRGVTGITRGILGPLSGKEEKKAESYLTAEWIEYEIHVPGEPIQSIRRQIFDLLGPAVRQDGIVPKQEIPEEQQLERSLALLSETELLILTCRLSPVFVEHLFTEKMLTNREKIKKLISNWPEATPRDLSEITPLPSLLYSLAASRWEWSRFDQDIFIKSPNIFTSHHGLRKEQEAKIANFYNFDIVTNDIGVRFQANKDPFLIRMEQGVLETNAEAMILLKFGEVVENTAEIFTRSKEQGIEWKVIQDSSEKKWQEVELPENVRIRIEEDLSKGYVIIAPQKPIAIKGKKQVGWWRIDPSSGEVLGFGESGKGQAYVSYVVSIAAGVGYFFLYVYVRCSDMEHGKEAIKCYICGFLQGLFFGLGAFLLIQKHILLGIISLISGGATNLVC